ncbi:hypothetical protein BH11GEM1_BH11GEM1_32990 [soil metagenome]
MSVVRARGILALATLVGLTAAAPAQAQSQGTFRIPFEQFTLPNGLQVILSPNRTVPEVAVDVWYHVGSKDDTPGRTGFAHLFEHVMFTGSGHVPYGMHDRLTEGVGGSKARATTSNDRTNYLDVVPSNYLETALWLESDRMGFLLDSLDEARFIAQRDIVQNERRRTTDEVPYGRWLEIISTARYPEAHPYYWPIVGYMADLRKAGVEDLRRFFQTWYAPSNATLTIVGDFDPSQAKRWITKYFGDLARGPAVVHPATPAAPLTVEKRLVFEDRVQLPQLNIAWPTVGDDERDVWALQFLERILVGTRTARISKALMYDTHRARELLAFNGGYETTGTFYLSITPMPGHSLDEVAMAADSVIGRFKREGPTADEMSRTAALKQVEFLKSLESNKGKADALSDGLVFHGDAHRVERDYATIAGITAADVKRVANRYLVHPRIMLSIVPLGKRDQAASGSTAITVAPDGGHYRVEH